MKTVRTTGRVISRSALTPILWRTATLQGSWSTDVTKHSLIPSKKLDPSRARILSTSLFPSPPITWGLLLALPLIVTVAFAAPGEEGAKPTVTEQVPFGLTCPLQVVEIENSRDPEMLPPLKVTFDRPFFGAVLVKRTTLIFAASDPHRNKGQRARGDLDDG